MGKWRDRSSCETCQFAKLGVKLWAKCFSSQHQKWDTMAIEMRRSWRFYHFILFVGIGQWDKKTIHWFHSFNRKIRQVVDMELWGACYVFVLTFCHESIDHGLNALVCSNLIKKDNNNNEISMIKKLINVSSTLNLIIIYFFNY